MTGIISLAAGLGSAIASSVEAGRASELAQIDTQQKKALISDIFDKTYYSDITKRTDVQNMLRLLQEGQEKQATKDAALGSITGAAQESQLAGQQVRNKSYADALAEIASSSSQLKDTYLNQYADRMLSLTDPSIAIMQNQSNQWGQAATNLFSTGASLFGKTDWTDL